MAIDSADVDADGIIYAGRKDSIYKSLDNGNSWAKVYTVPGSPIHIRRVFVASNGYVYTSGFSISDYGLYRSADGGTNWTRVIEMTVNTCIWAMDEDGDGNLFAGEYSQNGAGQSLIWKSSDDGDTWMQIYINDASTGDPIHGDHIHDIRCNPLSGYIYATYGDVDTITLIRSKDGGETWSTISSIGERLLAIAFLGDYIYVGSDTGSANKIYRFIDNGGASVTLETAYTFPADYDSQSFCAGESGEKVFFGTVTPTGTGADGVSIVEYDGATWTTPYTTLKPITHEGYYSVSRHNKDGIYYVSNYNELGIKFVP